MAKLVSRIVVGIISWEGMHESAKRIAENIKDAADGLIIIYSNKAEKKETGPGIWIQCPNSDYFGRKFDTLLNNILPECTLLLIQADAISSDWPKLINRYRHVMRERPDVGLWSPNIDNSAFPTSWVSIANSGDGLVAVLQTDAIVLGMNPDVLDRLRSVDYGSRVRTH